MFRRSTGSLQRPIIDLTDDTRGDALGSTSSAPEYIEEDFVPTFNLDFPDDEDDDGPDDDALRKAEISEDEDVIFLPHGPTIESAKAPSGTIVRSGRCYELSNGDFGLVDHIVQGQAPNQGIHLRGNRLVRTHLCEDMMPKKVNEVVIVMVINVDAQSDTNKNPQRDHHLENIPISSVICERKLVLTNLRFPRASFRELTHDYYDMYGRCFKTKALETGPLVCRWKWVSFYNTVDRKIKREALIQLRQPECDFGPSMSDVLIAQQWRSSPATADCKKRAQRDNEIDLTGDEDDDVQTQLHGDLSGLISPAAASLLSRSSTAKPSSPRLVRPPSTAPGATAYIYGDICAGAGGMASGAKQAGLQLKFLLDYWPDACKTLGLNFPDSKVMHMDIHNFCTSPRRSYRVDVLHISFPCQPHSPAHTINGSRDDENIATGYSVLPIFNICKPRVATFEQTPGIQERGGGRHFRALIHQITAAGYSVAWRKINMAEYGNPQPRRRLIIIAAAPGEKLPPFPKPTHGAGYAPLTTIWDVLQSIPRRDDDHMQWHTKKDEAPYNPHEPLKALITCSGGETDIHPSGKRSFTLRELALLQSFPANHRFYGLKGSIKKQIGNAVPSCFGKALFEEIVRSLRETDRAAALYKPETVQLD
ncbi:S-adenosyl-L-methionine-dependent methyltransferase [Teratosphaeria destructans]|uniref:DNA (cytosine-5-)-methyltransferase n=1 Tax=Teratosphaeria destructans TaxID=418781 RepID=A0A9W7SQ50_9PEZI|nr:S-adenosyl-L-methionine-dependent methyltransferase [Teratosphaeria destructans]